MIRNNYWGGGGGSWFWPLVIPSQVWFIDIGDALPIVLREVVTINIEDS